MRVEVECPPHLVLVVVARPREAVERDDERGAALLEVVDGRKAVAEPPDVRQDYGAQRPLRQVVPHEPEALLPGHAEEVDDETAVYGDPPEIHGDRGGPLVSDTRDRVDVRPGAAEILLGPQRLYLRERADQRGLAYSEPARDQDLDGHGCGTCLQ